MPTTDLKFVTQFGSDAGYGWSEVHYKQVGSSNPLLDVQLNNFILGVSSARQTLLGQDCFIVGHRVSYKTPLGIASNGKRQKLSGAAGHNGSAPALSLAVEFQNNDFTKSRICHMRGFWDSVEVDEVYRGDLDSDWTARLTAWVEALKAGYGWLTKDPALSAVGNCLGYVLGTDGRATITLDPTTPMPLAVVGTKQFVSLSKFNNSRSILNRSLQVVVESQVLLKTVKQIGAVENTSTGRFNFRSTSFVAYSGSDSISLGERRMGKPLNRRPGRSRAKVLS